MGAVVSSTNGEDNGGIVADLTHPSKPDWLNKHAVACNVSNEEIESLWQCFKDLGCNEDGEISGKTLAANKNNTMISRIVGMMPKTKDNALTFQTYCNMSRWMADATIEKKVRAVFQCLNKGQPLDCNILMEILSEIYCDESKEVIERSAKVFLHQVGDMIMHSISEEQFVRWAMQLPKDTIQAIMDFKCSQHHTQEQLSQVASSSQAVPVREGQPSTKDLMVVARMAGRKDWLLLANKLGFTENDISMIKEELPGQELDQIQRMLSQWKQRQDEAATLSVLKEALRGSNMDEIADKLDASTATSGPEMKVYS